MNSEENLNVNKPKISEFEGFSHIELYVGNIHQAVHYYRTAYGFEPIAYLGMETGIRDRASCILKQNDVKLIITSSITKNCSIAEHIYKHNDSVKDIALKVKDIDSTFHHLISKGAEPINEPQKFCDDDGEMFHAKVKTFGDTVHTLIQHNGGGECHLPNYQFLDTKKSNPAELQEIDHVAVCLDDHTLDQWVEFYKGIFGFHQSHHEDIVTEYSAMNSKVVQDSSENIKFALIEPAKGKNKSQIEEFLSFYECAGVQHVAFSTNDIVKTITSLKDMGIEFLKPPQRYYDRLPERIGRIGISVGELQENNVLADRDQWGYLMQAFTKPVQSIPTLFYEVIQRQNAKGFGGGNIKALFEAVEYEQMRRGNM